MSLLLMKLFETIALTRSVSGKMLKEQLHLAGDILLIHFQNSVWNTLNTDNELENRTTDEINKPQDSTHHCYY